MGKGNRNSQQRNDATLTQNEKLLAKENAKKNKAKKDKIVSAACIVIALLVVAVIALNVLSEVGVFLRAQTAISVKDNSDVTVDGAMMTYFFNDTITTWYNQYYAYVLYGLMSVDLNSSLKTQKITSTEASYLGDSSLAGTTWYKYFENITIKNVETYVTYANAAKTVAECALDADDKTAINDSIQGIKDTLKSSGMSLADQYGKGVTEGDIRKCLELVQLAANFSEYLLEQTKDKFEKDDAEVLKFPEDNKGNFYSAKYMSFTISVSEKTEGSQEKYDQAVANAKAAAEKLAEAATPADLAALIMLYKKKPSEFIKGEESEEESTAAADAQAEESAESESKTEETEEETDIEDVIDDYTETKYYETDDELGKWMFESAEENDVKVLEETETEVVTVKKTEAETDDSETEGETDSETETGDETEANDGKVTYEKFSITVYMLLEKASKDESLTHNMAYLISDNKAAAEAFLKAFLESDDKSRDKFEELAEAQYDKLHNVDEHGNHNHEEDEEEPVFSYYQVDQAKEKYFSDDYNAINDWLDSADRKNGDYTSELIVIEIKDSKGKVTDTYYAALVFEEHDDMAWYVDAFDGTVNEAMEDWYDAEIAKKLITYNWDVISGILG